MVPKPRSITTVGITQTLLAATFVVWLIFFPASATNFAWPISPIFSAMFLGAGFIMRTYIGIFLWREKTWDNLRWQAIANYVFLGIIFLATYWHIDQLNWETNILVAHIWILAYTLEPIVLPLWEPKYDRSAPLPVRLQRGPILFGLRQVALLGLIACVGIGGIAFINPEFLNTRWPWELTAFDARIMAAFFGMMAIWCAQIYKGNDWGAVRHAVYCMILFAASQTVIWAVNVRTLKRVNVNTFARSNVNTGE
jgi:hypothetical protein